jgi:hypothetical protein
MNSYESGHLLNRSLKVDDSGGDVRADLSRNELGLSKYDAGLRELEDWEASRFRRYNISKQEQ